MIDAGRRQLAFAAYVLIAHDGDHRARERFAVLVEDASGDDASAQQPHVNVAELLAVGKLDWCAGLRGMALPVDAIHESRLRGRDRVGARDEFADLEAPLLVGHRRAGDAGGRGRDRDARAFDGTAVVDRQHAAGDGRRSLGRWLLRAIARGALTPTALRLSLVLRLPLTLAGRGRRALLPNRLGGGHRRQQQDARQKRKCTGHAF